MEKKIRNDDTCHSLMKIPSIDFKSSSFIQNEKNKRNEGRSPSKLLYTYNPHPQYSCNNIHVALDNLYNPLMNREITNYTKEQSKIVKIDPYSLKSRQKKEVVEKNWKFTSRGWGYEVIKGIDLNDKERTLQAFYDHKDADINFQVSDSYGGYWWTKWMCRHVGDTALHLCIKFNRIEVFKHLLVLSPNLKLKNADGKTVENLMKEKFPQIDLNELVESEARRREEEAEAKRLEEQRIERSKISSIKTNLLRNEYLAHIEKEAKQLLFYGSNATRGAVSKRKSSIVLNQKDTIYLPNIPVERQIYFENHKYPQHRYHNEWNHKLEGNDANDMDQKEDISECKGINTFSVKSILRYEYINDDDIKALLKYVQEQADNDANKEGSLSTIQTSSKKLIFSNQRMHNSLILPLLNGIISCKNNVFSYIDLSCNCLTDPAALALAKILRLNKIPTHYHVRERYNDKHMTLSKPTENCKIIDVNNNSVNRDWGLISLILTGNRISDDGIISLISAILDTSYKIVERIETPIEKESPLTSQITETERRRQEALRSIQRTQGNYQNSNEMIHYYTPIKRIALNHNQMTWKGEEKLKLMLKNKRLHSLDGEDVILLF